MYVLSGVPGRSIDTSDTLDKYREEMSRDTVFRILHLQTSAVTISTSTARRCPGTPYSEYSTSKLAL
ncbi:hypothetical protein RRG08_018570 [Elysia crispata]|uniref:Uncharacterized protein n=1 Tax=Elysia crispata TaxID=231223 RepID=A0AAE0Y024_9GAST|nr:hypothetical protein RRG08_018570 [Elysia crispata]